MSDQKKTRITPNKKNKDTNKEETNKNKPKRKPKQVQVSKVSGRTWRTKRVPTNALKKKYGSSQSRYERRRAKEKKIKRVRELERQLKAEIGLAKKIKRERNEKKRKKKLEKQIKEGVYIPDSHKKPKSRISDRKIKEFLIRNDEKN
ncbi:hypothetical protein M0812_17876 [Anaeramoeba flamelloides]|uniref:rRNA-processing protein FYV7 n=1 Tax=Anaeramoeba flamelloides TaxID=1746091 RepID=A0AAV7Z1C3_9EUKA|nr:hypothetical protein M0812_17876 [Anaeramoeba flamelloides]